MHVQPCKINSPHTHIYPYEVSAMKRFFLQPVVPYTLQTMYVELFLMERLPIYWDTQDILYF